MSTSAVQNRDQSQATAASKGPITTFIDDASFDFVNHVQEFSEEASPAVSTAVEAFAEKVGGDADYTNVGTMKIGKLEFFVANTPSMKNNAANRTEFVALFDGNGTERARLKITSNASGTALYWVDRKTNKVGTRIDAQSKFSPASAKEKKALKAYVDGKLEHSSSLGRSVSKKHLPEGVLARYEQMERTDSDSTGITKFDFAGKTYYRLQDLACVEVDYFVSENNEVLHSYCVG